MQILDMAGKLPDHVVACVGGGSNAIGMFHPFVADVDAGDVKLVGVEAGGKGMDALNSATLTQGSPGVLHGTRTYLLQVLSVRVLYHVDKDLDVRYVRCYLSTRVL